MAIFGTKKQPKGPNLRELEEYKIDLSGISIRLKMPYSNVRPYFEKQYRQSKNLYDKSIYHSSKHNDPLKPPELGLVVNGWRYKGFTLFDNELGRMLLDISVAHMPDFCSLFRQRRFECAIERYIYLTELYSAAGKSRINFESQNINNIDWAHYECHASEDASIGFQSVWQTPLTDEHLLTVFFSQSGEFAKTGLKIAFSDLMNMIMSSLSIEWPEDILRQKNDVKNSYPCESFPENLPLYKCEYYDPIDGLDLARKVSAKYNHEITPDMQESFDAEVSQLEELEKQKQQATHQKNLDHHMRFEELEAEDRKRYLAE